MSQATWCIWEDCDQDAIYCEGHAREYMQPDINKLTAERDKLRDDKRRLTSTLDKALKLIQSGCAGETTTIIDEAIAVLKETA